jgi:hypothetical protein
MVEILIVLQSFSPKKGKTIELLRRRNGAKALIKNFIPFPGKME